MHFLKREKTEIPGISIFSKNFIVLFLISLLVQLAITTQMGTLPLYVNSLGGSAEFAGLIVGILGISSLFVRFPIGVILDRYSEKWILVIGLFLLLINFFLLSIQWGLWMLFLLRFFQGIGLGIVTTAAGTMIPGTLTKDNLAEGVSFFSIAQILPSALGPALGMFISQLYGYIFLFQIGFCLLVVAFLLAAFLTKQEKQLPLSKQKEVLDFSVLRNAQVMLPSSFMFLMCLGNASYIVYLGQFGIERGVKQIGFVFSIYAIASVLVRIILPYLNRKFTVIQLLVVGVLLMAGCLYLTAIATSFSVFAIAAVLDGIGLAFLTPLTNVQVIKGATKENIGKVTAVYTSSLDVAYGIGSFLWGWVISISDFSHMYLLVACFECMTIAILIIKKEAFR